MQLSGDRHASDCLIVAFRVRFDRLTPAEKSYLATMASLGEGPIAPEIRPKCSEKECVQLPSRAALIAKGMAYSPAHGTRASRYRFSMDR